MPTPFGMTTGNWDKKTLTATRYPTFRENEVDDPFDVTKSPLFKQAEETAGKQLSGDVAGFDTQAQIARETAKAVQAQKAKAQRELLMQSGLRDTGTYIKEGLMKPEEESQREYLDLERRLAANRGELGMAQQQAGQQAASNLLNIRSGFGLEREKLASQERMQEKDIASREKLGLAELSIREKDLVQSGSQFKDKLAFDKYALDAGYTEAEKQRAWQAIENQRAQASTERVAFAELGVREKALAQEGMQFASKMDFDKYALEKGYSEAEKERAWKAIENEKQLQSQEKIAKMEIASKEKIAEDQLLIQKQGLSLQEAELYGYTDANGNHVSGSAERAGAQLGLQQKTLDMQQKELFGWTDEKGVYHDGKYDLLSKESQREADRLYGYQIKDKDGNVIGNVAGELQLKADQVEIERQGLKLNEAQIFGYDKDTDGDGKPDTHVDGQMDLNMKKYGLEKGAYEDNRLKMFGGIGPDGKPIKGELQIAAEELGLKEKSLQLQKDELFGYTDESGVWHEGKYSLLTKEQQMAADDMYGYKDPKTGEWVPGKWDKVKETLKLQLENDLKKMEKDYGYQATMEELKKKLTMELQNNNHENAKELLDLQQKFTAEQAVLDREIEWARVNLQKAGFDFTVIQEMIKNGQMDAKVAADFAKIILKEKGIDFVPPNPDAIYDQLNKDYKVQQYQFALTHPEYAMYDKNGKFTGLKDEGSKLFQEFLNNSYYGPDGKPITGGVPINTGTPDKDGNTYYTSIENGYPVIRMKEGGVDTEVNLTLDKFGNVLRGADNESNQNYKVYQELISKAPTPNITISSKTSNDLKGVPAKGSIITSGGRLLVMLSGVVHSKEGRNHDEFTVMDLATGAKRTFTGFSAGDDSIYNMSNWLSDLSGM